MIFAALLIAYFWFNWDILLFIAASLALIIAFFPVCAYYISFLWQQLGKIIGFFVSKIILAIIFIFILTPIAILYRLFSKKRPISEKNAKSYWVYKDNRDIDFNKLW